MPTTTTVSKAKAERFLKALRRHWETPQATPEGFTFEQACAWAEATSGDTTTMRLSWDWSDDGQPVIIWEDGAPFEWTYGLPDMGVTGVHHEAYNGCVLALYPS